MEPSFITTRKCGNITRLLASRSIKKDHINILYWMEYQSLCSKYTSTRNIDLPNTTKSAIAIAFSTDGLRLASTHGDHTVKVIDYESGKTISVRIIIYYIYQTNCRL